MAVFKCKMCGGSLDIADGISIATCEYCGTKQTVPKSRDEVVSNLFNRANNLRLKCEFDKAEQVYEKILDIDNTDPEAHWGVVLCKYGIEYVEDPQTYSRIPTCHRTLYEPVLTDVNYLSAIENADEEQKELYIAEAKMIDELQKDILNIVNNEEPFDVFICYKETDENGKRTIDSAITNDIYYQLTQEGFKVFYAPITLEDKLGHEYEPYIFAALNSAKVMLVVGTKPEYFDSVWVRNEWSRFFKTMKNDRSKLLIPCYRDMDVYELPDEFAHLQAQDMSKIGFVSDVIRGLKKVFDRDVQVQPKIAKKKVKKPSKIKSFWKKFKINQHLSFPLPKITSVFFVFTIIFYIYLLIRMAGFLYWFDMFIFSLFGLAFVVPALIFARLIRRKTTAIIIETVSMLLGPGFCFSDIAHSVMYGYFLMSVIMLILCLIWMVLVCLTKRIKDKPKTKKKWHIVIISTIVSLVLIVAFEMFGITMDYQLAKIFYNCGAYEYSEEYFRYLGDYRDSEDLSKNSILYRAIELLDDDEATALRWLSDISSYIESKDFAKELVYNNASSLIEQNNTDTAISLLSLIPKYKDSYDKSGTILYSRAEEFYASKKYGDALEILFNLGDFGDSKALITSIQTKIKNTSLPKINTSKYIKCSVDELYKNPYKYNGEKVVITSSKVNSYYHSQTYAGTFYDFLLCDDLTHCEENVDDSIPPFTYFYYKEYIKPYNTPYIGARAFSDVIYKNISDKRSKMLVYGTFTYHRLKTEGDRRIADPHVYDLDVDYYVEY